MPFGEPWVRQINWNYALLHGESRYTFTGKERDEETGLMYFSDRYYNPDLGIFTQPDKLHYKTPGWTSYNYCNNNPLFYVDPDGKTPWPVKALFNGYGRSHLNNWHEVRYKAGGGTRLHQGLDINHNGGGNTDYGAPIVSTHDGYVSRISTNNNDAGGRRIVITSKNGTVSTSYMHLSSVKDLKEGDFVSEGQEIGLMGGSGFGKDNAYISHLHYELRLNGENINPVDANGNLIDPQILLKLSEKNIQTQRAQPSKLQQMIKEFYKGKTLMQYIKNYMQQKTVNE
jgi:RHS repeat-associated protein